MTTLLRQIQDEAVDHNVPVTSLLRRALVLARRLDYPPLAEWAQCELDGYPKGADLPEYRAWRPANVLGDFSGYMQSSIRNQPLWSGAVDERFHRLLFGFELRHGVAEYQSAVANGDNHMVFPWDQNFVAFHQDAFLQDYSLVTARRVVNVTQLEQLLDAVRTRLLNFALEIEAEAPDAGEADAGAPAVPAERVAAAFEIHITGDHNVVATAGRDVHQHVVLDDDPRWLSLRSALAQEVGLSESELMELQQALEADAQRQLPPGSLGPATTKWYQRITEKIASGGVEVANKAGVAAVTQLLLKFVGAA